MLRAQGSLHRSGVPNHHGRTKSVKRHSLMVSVESTNTSSPDSSSGRIPLSDTWSCLSYGHSTGASPVAVGPPNDGFLHVAHSRPALTDETVSAFDPLTTDFSFSDLSSTQRFKLDAAAWRLIGNERNEFSQYMDDYVRGSLDSMKNPDGEPSWDHSQYRPSSVEDQIRLPFTEAHVLPLNQPFQGLPNCTSQDRDFHETDIQMQDQTTLLSEPWYNSDLAVPVTPWSHVDAAAAEAPPSDVALFWGDPKAYLDRLAPPRPLPQKAPGDSEKPFRVSRSENMQACSESCEGSSSGDSVDPPRGDNPVGPPDESTDLSHNSFDGNRIQPAGKLGRNHSLNPEQRRHAALMRAVRNCWPCVFLKYPCDEYDKCEKCRKMRRASLLWSPLPWCDRTILSELTTFFLPPVLVDQHTVENLSAFCKDHVAQWTENQFTVHLTWGCGKPIGCHVTEVKSVGESLLYQNQYRLNLATNSYQRCREPSPPIGIMLLDVETWGSELDAYLNNFLDNDFDGFPDACFHGYDCEIQRDLLRPLHQYLLDSTDGSLPRLSLKLVILTHIMTHSLTLCEDALDIVASRLLNAPSQGYGTQTCPRWLNKELKFVLACLHEKLFRDVLTLIHKALRDMSTNSSHRFWARLFIGVLVLAMVTESLQVAVRCKEETDMSAGITYPSRNYATSTIEKSDETLDYVTRLFRSRYHMNNGKKEMNPVRNLGDRKNLKDPPSEALASKVRSLMDKYRGFLEARSTLGPPENPREPRTSRLVAKFLLYF